MRLKRDMREVREIKIDMREERETDERATGTALHTTHAHTALNHRTRAHIDTWHAAMSRQTGRSEARDDTRRRGDESERGARGESKRRR